LASFQLIATRLHGYRGLILETRESARFSHAPGEQGGEPVLQRPMFTITDAPDAGRGLDQVFHR
jgi:hypothetical protein